MIKKAIGFISFILVLTSVLMGQDMNEKLTLDPQIRYGKLDNGFTYYIKNNEEPKDRLELRLAVNAGSICEEDDQQGLAHLLEHLCFNGTKNFEKSAIIDFLESTGVKFGQHLNAYTSFDETVYMLQLPTDRQGLLDTAFMIMEDWAHQVNLDEVEIDKERGVVKEEWRLGLGANERMRNEYFPILMKDSKYANRLPIGKMDVIENCEYERIRSFYSGWYRPDLMALVVVGDVDVDEMEAKVKSHFAKITNPENAPARVEYDIPDNKEPLVAIVTDEEATYTMINIFYKHEKEIKTTVNGYRDYLKEQLYNGMLNARLAEIMQSPTSPMMYGYTGYGSFLGRSKDAYTSFAISKPDQIKNALQVLLEENERVEQFGFTATEFERQKAEVLRGYEKNYNEREKTKSRGLAMEYVYNFLSQEPAPGIEKEFEMANQLVPTIKLDEINQLAKKWVTDENIAILIAAPEKEEVIVPTEEEVIAVFAAAKSAELTAYEDQVSEDPLIGQEIVAGTVVKVDEVKAGYEVWTLSNGVEVYLKPTDFKNDEILFKSYTTGGSSLLEDNEIVTESVFADVINQSGLGQFKGVELEKKLAGKIVGLNSYLGELKQGFSGNSSPKDLETLLQLQYLYFTNPYKDAEIFAKVIDNLKNQVKFMMDNPRVAYFDKLYKVATSDDPRTIVIPTEEQINSIQYDRIYEFYKELYQQADGFKFFFVGNINKDELKPLVEKYLASLPVSGTVKKWEDQSATFPDGKTEFTVNKGKEPQSMITVMMEGDYKYNFSNNLTFKTLEKILSITLREQLREEASGTYGVSVRKTIEKYPNPEYNLSVSFGCAPENVESLVEIVFKEFNRIQTEGPTEVDLNKAKETFLRERETNVKENRYWLRKLENVAFLDSKVITDEEYNKAVKAITVDDVKKAANVYITPDHFVYGVLMPEE